MIKLYTFVLSQDMNFGQLELKAGTELGAFQTELDVDPIVVFNAFQYRQVSVQVTEFDPEELLNQQGIDTSLAGDESEDSDDDSEGGDSQSPNVDSTPSVSTEPTVAPSDLYSIGLTEGTVKALVSAKIDSVQSLVEYVRSGKDLGDLEGIGPKKVEAIMTAIEKLLAPVESSGDKPTEPTKPTE
jgi:hypothetical protein